MPPDPTAVIDPSELYEQLVRVAVSERTVAVGWETEVVPDAVHPLLSVTVAE